MPIATSNARAFMQACAIHVCRTATVNGIIRKQQNLLHDTATPYVEVVTLCAGASTRLYMPHFTRLYMPHFTRLYMPMFHDDDDDDGGDDDDDDDDDEDDEEDDYDGAADDD